MFSVSNYFPTFFHSIFMTFLFFFLGEEVFDNKYTNIITDQAIRSYLIVVVTDNVPYSQGFFL